MKLIAFDTETFLIAPGILAPRLVCGSFSDGTHTEVLDAKETALKFRSLLNDSLCHIGGANLTYDLGVMCAYDSSFVPLIFKALDEGRLHCTHILEALYDNSRGRLFIDDNGRPFARYSLAMLEDRYFNIDRSADKKGENAWRLRYSELANTPIGFWPHDATEYPKRDAKGTYDVLALQLARTNSNVECEAGEMRAAWFLHIASMWGMRTDAGLVAQFKEHVLKEHEESRETFSKVGFVERQKNGKWKTNTKTIKARVEEAYAGAPPKTPGDGTSISADTLLESGDALLEAFAESAGNEKLLSSFLSVLEGGTRTGINPSVNTLVATQRTSYRSPNLQQLPRKGGVRECFTPRPGWVYCSVDYSALELCTLAQVCLWLFSESEMANAINAGRDLHLQLAASFAGVSYEEAQALRKAKDKEIGDLRQAAKPVNFGVPGMMGPPKLTFTARKQGARFCELSGVLDKCGDHGKVSVYKYRPIAATCRECLALATKYHAAYYEAWPEVRQYHASTKAQSEECENGTPLKSFGSGMLRLEPSINAVSNHFFQNLAAQGAKHAGWSLVKETFTNSKSVLYGNLRPVVFVHDEIVAEIREDVMHEAATRMSEIMVSAMREYVPDVKIVAEPALMRRWFKGADPVYSASKKLLPWWPKEWSWEADKAAMAKDQEMACK